MQTFQYLWRPDRGEDHARFASRALVEVPQAIEGLGASELWLHLTEEAPPWLSLVPFRRGLLGLVSLRGEDEEVGLRALTALESLGMRWAGYRVTEAQPLPRARFASAGGRSPGACLLTLFRRRRGLTREAFLSCWHGGHTPLSLKVHPFVSYVRCTVEGVLSPGSPSWEGIVTESVASRPELLNPLLLFGGPRRALFNMVRVGRDIAGFMDLLSMESYLVAEYGL